jgi:cytoskeletal protein RodZ
MSDAAQSRRWPPQESWRGLLPAGDPTARFESGQTSDTPVQLAKQRRRPRSAARPSDWWLPLAMVAAAAALLVGSLWWLQRSAGQPQALAQTEAAGQGSPPISQPSQKPEVGRGANRTAPPRSTETTNPGGRNAADVDPALAAERPRFERAEELSVQPLDMPEDFPTARPMQPVFEPQSGTEPSTPFDIADPGQTPPLNSPPPLETAEPDAVRRWEAWQQLEDRLAEVLVLPQPEPWRQRLAEAEPAVNDPPQLHQQWAAWKQLGESYRRYLEAVQAAIDRLGAGEQLELPSGQVYGVVEASAQQLILRARGQDRSWDRHALPPAVSLALADLQLDRSRPADLLARGLFCWVDPQSNPLLQTRGLAWLVEAHREQPLSAELLELLARRFAFPAEQLR